MEENGLNFQNVWGEKKKTPTVDLVRKLIPPQVKASQLNMAVICNQYYVKSITAEGSVLIT